MHQTLSHYPAPKFGKTAGISKSPALAGSYGGVKGFSEIGRWERKMLVRQINRGFLKFRAVLLCVVR